MDDGASMTLSKKQIRIEIQLWADIVRGALNAANEDCKATGGDLGSRRWKPIITMLTAYTNELETRLGSDQWLDWFAWECKFGESPKKAYFDGKEYPCGNIRKLVNIVAEQRRRNAK